MSLKKIQSALISVFHKDRLTPIIHKLDALGVELYSTGGTEKFIKEQGISVTSVESVTDYPSIFGGRVKTLHPKILGGILHRRNHEADEKESLQYKIPPIDLVIVDLYPFEQTALAGGSEQELIEKIDIGGIALIRAAAKNFKDVLVVSSRSYYEDLEQILDEQAATTTIKQRKLFAVRAFEISSHYDTAIFNTLSQKNEVGVFKTSASPAWELRYGENPHQQGIFYGNFSDYFDQLHGKEISYNNLVDIEAAVQLIAEFKETTVAILKHNNACGIAIGESVSDAYLKALLADKISAFGGIIVSNKEINLEVANIMNTLFFDILIAPSFTKESLEILKSRKKRTLLLQKKRWQQQTQFKSLLNGIIVQNYDLTSETVADFEIKTNKVPSKDEAEDLVFALKVSKQSKSNTIVLAKNGQLLASGVGQTSRVDALNQAIEKATKFWLRPKWCGYGFGRFLSFP